MKIEVRHDRPESAEDTTVLIVEDEIVGAWSMTQQLDQLGYRVCGIADCEKDALELAETYRPKRVLMDVRLRGEGDGIAVALKLRQRFDQPVIFVSGHLDQATFERAVQARPVAFLPKPVSLTELDRVLRA